MLERWVQGSAVAELDAKIIELCDPYARQIAHLDAIPGSGGITAQDISPRSGRT